MIAFGGIDPDKREKMSITIDPGWIGWLAGIFDGEGNLRFKKRKNCHGLLLVVQVTNTDLSTINKIKSLIGFGTTRQVNKKSNGRGKGKMWKDQYSWNTGSREARQFLEIISDYLICKKERAILAIDLQKRITERRGMSSEGVARRKFRESAGKKVNCFILAGGRHISQKELETRNNLNQQIIELNRRGKNYDSGG